MLYLFYYKNLHLPFDYYPWINHIHKIVNDSRMSYIWTLQYCISEKWLKLVIKNNLIYQFKQIWNSSIETSSKGGNYKLFKGELKLENYLDILEDKYKFTLCRFRTTNHRLPVEVGR